MLLPEKYDYVTILFIADYCPQCLAFTPKVKAASAAFEKKRCKILVCTNDKTEQDYFVTCQKTMGLDILPYNKSRTRLMRDLFGLMTIPALVILENADFTTTPPLITPNARKILESDSTLKAFPWDPKTATGELSKLNRFLIGANHGEWYSLGHRNVSAIHPEHMYMDGHAVRLRAGVLNILLWIALIVLFFFQNQVYLKVLFPLLTFEFSASAVAGMTPIAPIGTLSSMLILWIQPKPHWRPAPPMRFANAMGVAVSLSCVLIYNFKSSLGSAFETTMGVFASCFCLSTWLQSSTGFCMGCYTYTTFLVPWFELPTVEECESSL